MEDLAQSDWQGWQAFGGSGSGYLRTSTGVPVVEQWLLNPTRNHEVAGSIPDLLSGLTIWHCRELWYRSQTRLGSGIAVAVV